MLPSTLIRVALPVLEDNLLEHEGGIGIVIRVQGRELYDGSLVGVLEIKYLLDVFLVSVFLRPSGNTLGYRVHEGDLVMDVGGDNAVLDAVEDGGGEAFLPFEGLIDPVLVYRYVYGGIEFFVLEGLQDIPEGLGYLRPFQGFLVGISGKKYNRDLEPLFYDARGFDTVHFTGQHDVHEDDVGLIFAGFLYGFRSLGGYAG